MAKLPEKQSTPIRHAASKDEDAFAQELAKRLGSILPAGQRTQVVAQVVSLVSEERFSGPIAHPKHLREYEEICPGSADRIIKMAEGQLEHAKAIQSRALDGDIADTKEGRRLGFAALLVLIIGAIICGILGKDTIALALLGASVIGTIGTIIRGRGKNGGN